MCPRLHPVQLLLQSCCTLLRRSLCLRQPLCTHGSQNNSRWGVDGIGTCRGEARIACLTAAPCACSRAWTRCRGEARIACLTAAPCACSKAWTSRCGPGCLPDSCTLCMQQGVDEQVWARLMLGLQFKTAQHGIGRWAQQCRRVCAGCTQPTRRLAFATVSASDVRCSALLWHCLSSEHSFSTLAVSSLTSSSPCCLDSARRCKEPMKRRAQILLTLESVKCTRGQTPCIAALARLCPTKTCT